MPSLPALAKCSLVALAGCAALAGLGDYAGAPSDAAAAAAADAAADAGGTYHALKEPANWTFFNLAKLGAGPASFAGAALDDHYLYLAPSGTDGAPAATAARYDLAQDFTDPVAAWTTFDLTVVSPNARGYQGAVFARGLLYLVPRFGLASGTWGTTVAAYDPSAPFTNPTSWSTFDLNMVDGNSGGFIGAAVAGQYIYFAGAKSDDMTRFDTSLKLTDKNAWQVYAVPSLLGGGERFEGAVFDGQGVLFSPLGVMSPGTSSSIVLYYDGASANYADNASWKTFDLSQLAGDSGTTVGDFAGAVFDGQYVYFAPHGDGTLSIVVRYDASRPFMDSASWSTFDAMRVNDSAHGFAHGAFDGRYVYFVPAGPEAAPLGTIVRFDTTRSFGDVGSWEAFNVADLKADAVGFGSAAFDGRYLYLVPFSKSWIARFDARSPSVRPPNLPASFF